MASTKTDSPTSLSSTRQMLDELDALMERMLALPVNDLDDVAGATPAPMLSATLTVLESPEPEVQEQDQAAEPSSAAAYETSLEPPPAPRSASEDYFQTEEPASRPEVESTPPAPVYSWSESPPPVREGSFPPLVEPRPQLVFRPRRSLMGRLLSPVIRFNLAFDRGLARLGWAGRWLRGPAGRMVLGVTGLGMAALAIVWLIRDFASWTR